MMMAQQHAFFSTHRPPPSLPATLETFSSWILVLIEWSSGALLDSTYVYIVFKADLCTLAGEDPPTVGHLAFTYQLPTAENLLPIP